MSEAQTEYRVAMGIIQAFKKDGVQQPAVRTGNANGQNVYNITIKTGSNLYVDVALWSEYEDVAPKLTKGMFVAVSGKYTTNESNGKLYHKISAYDLVVVPGQVRKERPVENQQATAGTEAAAAPAAGGAYSF